VTFEWSPVVWGACSCTKSVQTGTTACKGSDGSTPSTSEVCGTKPATSRSCTPATGCGTSGGGGTTDGDGGGTTDGSSGGAGTDGAGGGGIGGGGSTDSGSDSDSSSFGGASIMWIGIGAGAGVVLTGLIALALYFCYFKPRHVPKADIQVKAESRPSGPGAGRPTATSGSKAASPRNASGGGLPAQNLAAIQSSPGPAVMPALPEQGHAYAPNTNFQQQQQQQYQNGPGTGPAALAPRYSSEGQDSHHFQYVPQPQADGSLSNAGSAPPGSTGEAAARSPPQQQLEAQTIPGVSPGPYANANTNARLPNPQLRYARAGGNRPPPFALRRPAGLMGQQPPLGQRPQSAQPPQQPDQQFQSGEQFQSSQQPQFGQQFQMSQAASTGSTSPSGAPPQWAAPAGSPALSPPRFAGAASVQPANVQTQRNALRLQQLNLRVQ
jgi:hypothetical protein